MSRRALITAEVQEQFCGMVGVGYSRRRAAYQLGFSESSMRTAMRRNEAFHENVLRAERRREILALNDVRQATTKSWRAAKWFLERIAPNAYGPRTHEAVAKNTLDTYSRPVIDVILNEISDHALRNKIIHKLNRIQDRTAESRRWDEGLPPDFARDVVADRYGKASWLEQLAEVLPVDPDDVDDDAVATWDGPHI